MSLARFHFGEVRSALERGPSPSAWLALCESLEAITPGRFDAELWPYLSAHLQHWPETLCVAPGRWVDAMLEGQSAPWFRLVRALDLRQLELDLDDIARLDQHEALSSVRILELSGNALGEQGAKVLATWERISRSLHTLRVGECGLGDEGLTILSHAPWLAQLDELDLSQNKLSAQGLDALSRQQWLSLKRLDLSGNLINGHGLRCLSVAAPILEQLRLISARLSPQALEAFGQGFARLERLELGAMLNDAALIHWAHQRCLPRLSALILRNNRFGPLGAAALANSQMIEPLKVLDLSFNAISDRGLEAISARAGLGLDKLALEGCAISAAGARALAQADWLERLTELDLRRNALGGVGVELMLSQQTPLALRTLHLSSNQIGPRGCRALASASLPSLKTLNLAHNHVGDEGCQALAQASWLGHLERLRLSGQQITATGAAALAAAPAHSLSELAFSHGALGDEGLELLLRAPWASSLERLELDGCGLGPAGAAALAGATHMERLSVLSLRENLLGSRAARALAQADHLARLEILDLSNNPIGDEGLEALVELSLWPKLRELRLVAGQITSRGVCALALAAKPWTSLEVLDLGSNRIDDEGGQALAQSERLPALRRLELGANALGARGMAALLKARGLRRLEFLGLVSNPLSPTEARALVNELWLPSLRSVQLWWNTLGQEGKRVIERAVLRANSRKAALTMTG